MPTFSKIEELVGFGYDVFNVLTEDSYWTTNDGKQVKTCAKTPVKNGKYAFKGPVSMANMLSRDGKRQLIRN